MEASADPVAKIEVGTCASSVLEAQVVDEPVLREVVASVAENIVSLMKTVT